LYEQGSTISDWRLDPVGSNLWLATAPTMPWRELLWCASTWIGKPMALPQNRQNPGTETVGAGQ
jgi:hypothetical protein